MSQEYLDNLLKITILKEIIKNCESDDDDDDRSSPKECDIGLRVVRGPDWKWDDHDGGEGSVGTVVDIGSGDNAPTTVVTVQWDNGIQKKYRAGLTGAYDLRTLDNAPYGVRHKGVMCDTCRKNDIFGIRWKCQDCRDFDLCNECYMAGRHDITHLFFRYLTPDSTRVEVPKRQGSVRIQMKGIFPSAKVVRGPDWKWGDQDGGAGQVGTVLELRPWNDETDRNSVRIEWPDKIDIYRLGYAGKVDVKYVQAAADGFYYRDHLPITGDELRPVKVEVRSNSTAEPISRQSSVSENRRTNINLADKVIMDSTLTKKGLIHLSGNFKDLFYNKKFYDFEIKVRDQIFHVHKAIISIRAPYFASKFQENDRILEVEDCSPNVFKDYLYYVYTGEIVSTSDETIRALMGIADKYEDKVLKIECNRVLKKIFAIDNLCNFLAVA